MTGWDDDIETAVLAAAAAAVAAGADPEAALTAASPAIARVLEDQGHDLASELLRTAPPMLAWHRRRQRSRDRQVRRHWGAALDLMFTINVCAEEIGANKNRDHWAETNDAEDPLFDAIVGLHARACRVGLEVHRLLTGGFPMGALARCRTMHEIAVTTIVLAEYGRQEAYLDLGERYVRHEQVLNWSDAQVFQSHSERLGEQPFSDDELAEMKATRDALVGRFGDDYKKPFGWAHELPITRCTFDELERLASLSHLRSYYKWASHEVHADSKGGAANTFENGGTSYLATGPTIDGLADPGSLASLSLLQTSVSLLLLHGANGSSPSVKDLITSRCLIQMVKEADAELFRAADADATTGNHRLYPQFLVKHLDQMLRRWDRVRWQLEAHFRANQAETRSSGDGPQPTTLDGQI